MTPEQNERMQPAYTAGNWTQFILSAVLVISIEIEGHAATGRREKKGGETIVTSHDR